MPNRLIHCALFLLVVLIAGAAYADCTVTASGSLDPVAWAGASSQLTCSGSYAKASATLTIGPPPACGKLTLWDLDANVQIARQTGCGTLSVSGGSYYGGSTNFLTVLTNHDTNTATYTHYISV